jgi:hypothetical protein
MVKHRSLDHALVLTPELDDFIHRGESLKPHSDNRVAPAAPGNEGALQLTVEPPPSASDRERKRQPAAEPWHASYPSHFQPAPTVLVPLTTRLQPDTAEALRRVHLENKLNRVQPDSQQAIVEFALREWLTRHGFLSASTDLK